MKTQEAVKQTDESKAFRETMGGVDKSIATSRTIVLLDTEDTMKESRRILSEVGLTVISPSECRDAGTCAAALINPDADPDFTVCRSLSENCRVLLISNNREFAFKIKAVRMGAAGLVSSPLNAVEVLSSLEVTHRSDVPDARVLIIDDDELTSSVYALALEECGLRVAVLPNPLQVEAAITEFGPDLLIMDIDMPQASGLDVARAIRLDQQYTSLPILFLSSVSNKEIQDLARHVGGDDFIKKPVDVGYLVKLVRMRAERAVDLRQIMARDGLTGLLNHVNFKEKLETELHRSARSGSTFSVALLDLDHFKSVNDTYGHQVGDTVIQTFASHLKCSLRNIDIVGRYGGEEFAVVLLDAGPGQAAIIFDRIRKEFERIEFRSAEAAFHVTFSCGVVGSDAGRSGEALLSHADLALYEAKENGRNRVCEYVPSFARRSEYALLGPEVRDA
ncbi:diguanylate cyclase [Roseibium aggregatum]|jgi:diguanylate cyclase (GGDEF)-like protein|uniref:GGDEF domain-containing protein n=1 Tax=Roseibium aggregatum TaxID=187304 RepID=UPI003A97213A